MTTPKDSQHMISYKLGEHPKPLEPIISEKNQLQRSMTPFDLEGGVGGQK